MKKGKKKKYIITVYPILTEKLQEFVKSFLGKHDKPIRRNIINENTKKD